MEPNLPRELASVAGELNNLSAVFAEGQAAMRAESEGSDPRGAVSVLLDETGRVTAVRPSAQWRDRVVPDHLGAAVLEAVQDAQRRRFERWAEAVGDGTERMRGDGAPGPARPAVTPLVPAPGPAVDLMSLLDDVLSAFEALERLSAAAPEPAAAHTSAGTSRVRVTLAGTDTPVAVDVDPAWAAGTSLARLGEEILAAFQVAYEEAERRAAEAPSALPGAGMSPAMAAVARDPAGMLLRYAQELGVEPPPDAEDPNQTRRP